MPRVKKIGESLIYWGLYLPVIILTGSFVFVTIAPLFTDARWQGLALMVPVVLSIPVGLSLAAVGVEMRGCFERSRKAEARVKGITTDQYGTTESVLW